MRRVVTILILNFSAYICCIYGQTQKELKLANIFGDNMVIQQGVDIPIWGFAAPSSEVIVSSLNNEFKTYADKEGKWLLKLPPIKAGGPFELKVCSGKTLVLKNVMAGEVWLASGQSNMEFTMKKTLSFKEDSALANYPEIRTFTVPSDVSMSPKEDIKSNQWRICTPANLSNFSAVAYHFARELHQHLKVPVGIISSSRGGTPAEAWTSAETLAAFPEFKDKIINLKKKASSWEEKARELQKLQNERTEIVRTADKGLKLGVNSIFYDDRQWLIKDYPIDMPKLGKPGYWGFVWFRKTIELQQKDLSGSLSLRLPLAAQQYLLYFNGVEIGKGENSPASFTIPQELLKEGKNILAVRILSFYGKGQLGLENEPAFITPFNGKESIQLNGEWKFNFNIEPHIAGAQSYAQTPTVLYNAMIAPLMPFAIKGVIWYQGEANTTNPYLYRSLFPAMVENWRSNWGLGDFPFVYVQLAGYSRPGEEDLKWALLREAQFASLKTPNTIMVTAVDVGEEKDIHPRNKKEVGYRLALAVRNKVYHENIVCSGPVFKDFKIQKNTILIEFTGTGSGLIQKDDKPLTSFEIAGKDMLYFPADAVIINDKVSVSSPKVSKPVAVRFAFKSFPQINLYNKEGLPALPFRTDYREK